MICRNVAQIVLAATLREAARKKLNLICGATGEDANNVGKPDWCPLRELPEKKENDSFLIEAVKNDCFDGTDSDTAYFNGKDAGWNACLDAIANE